MSKQQGHGGHTTFAKSRRTRLVALSLALMAVLLVGGTLAWLSGRGSGDFAFALQGTTTAEFDGGFFQKSGSGSNVTYTARTIDAGLLPGSSVQTQAGTNDKVTVKNTGNECYVLVRLHVTRADKTTKPVTEADTLAADTITLFTQTLRNGEGSVATTGYTTTPGAVDQGSGDGESKVYALGDKFQNMTTQADFSHGLLTFMYRGTLARQQTVTLLDRIQAPSSWQSGLPACAVTAHVQTVPATDVADADAAYARLVALDPVTNYYTAGA